MRTRGPLLERARLVERANRFLARTANPDGSFGRVQPVMQTSLAVLAFLSSGISPTDRAYGSTVRKACEWLVSKSGGDGFIGDSQYPHESHAVAGIALASLIGMAGDAELDHKISRAADRALRYSLRVQSRAVGAAYFGGWAPSPREKVNDRLVTAWHLFFLKTMIYARRKVPERSISRATCFVLGSQKDPGETHVKYEREDIGGFSYDAAGLPVVSVTSAGLAVISLYNLPRRKGELAVRWLQEHPPIWYGPRFYVTHFFGVRGLLRHSRITGLDKEWRSYFNRLFQLLREHQGPDGSFDIPPGNAENTKVMGKTYGTAMAILILNADRALLPLDMEP